MWPVVTVAVLDGEDYGIFYRHRNFYLGSAAHEDTKQYLGQCSDRE